MNLPLIGSGEKDLSAYVSGVVEHFEAAWRAGESPDIAAVLSAAERLLSPAGRTELVAALVLCDLEYRWRRTGARVGESRSPPDAPPRLEDYLARFPELAPNGEFSARLIAAEYRVRQRAGDRPTLHEYLKRFPFLARDKAAALAAADRELGADVARTLADAAEERKPGSTLRVRCPHCQNLVETIGEGSLADIVCDACGNCFRLIDPSEETCEATARKTLGHFDLVERVGMGAFGEVWKARDQKLDRTVAVKVPRKGSLSPAEADKFLREARTAAQLRHPNVVSIHEVGRSGETIYLVSDFVRGVTLADWLTGQRPTVRRAAELCVTIAEALHHAHEAGVVHRDLKPGNIMIDGEGQPHVMDFGLARRGASDVTMTLDGQVLGTPAYMSPEQARGEAHTADRRTDVYSLGVILYELLTGEVPFRGNVRMMIHQVLHEEPPSPRKLNHLVKRDLETICLKCLEKNPDKRYSTAHEVAADLRRFLRGEAIAARPITRLGRGWRWCRRNPVVASLSGLAALLLVGILAVVAGAYVQTRDALTKTQDARRAAQIESQRAKGALAQVTLESARADEQRRLAQTTLVDMYASHGLAAAERNEVQEALLWFATAAISADSDADREWANRLRFRNWLRRIPVPLHAIRNPLGQVVDIKIHPSNRYVLLLTTEGTVLWSLETGATSPRPNCHAAWNSDGDLLAIGAPDGGVEILAFPQETVSQRFRLAERTAPRVAFSKDGRLLAAGAETVRVWDRGKGDFLSGEALHPAPVLSLEFGADASCLVTSCADQRGRVFGVTPDQIDSASRFPPIPHQTGGGVGCKFYPPLLVSDERALFAESKNRLRSADLRTGHRQESIGVEGRIIAAATLNEDRTKLALSTDVPGYGVWIYDFRTQGLTSVIDQAPSRTPGIAFQAGNATLATAGHEQMLRFWNAAKGESAGPAVQHQGHLEIVAFSPDGALCATAQPDQTVRVFRVPVMG